jgi:molybdate transport system ATP-binding protein
MLRLSARVASRGFDAELDVAVGETIAILGPNGAGKSTLLEVLAGLVRPDSGSAMLEDTILFRMVPEAKPVWVPPHARGVSLLAQQPLLFPRMTVQDNVAFGPRSAGLGRRESRRRAAHWLAQVDAADFALRKPAQLSGGQAQRIAVARALASGPRLLLLDEPMAALDVTVTPTLRRTLRRVLADQTTILVTHDVLDAFTLADRVAVMRDGRIIETGATRDVFERPRTPFTAALVALNLFTGSRTSDGLKTSGGLELRGVADKAIANGVEVGATISPTALTITPLRGTERSRYYFETVVTDLEPRGDLIRVSTEFAFADVAPAVLAGLDLVPGTRVWAGFAPSDLRIYAL